MSLKAIRLAGVAIALTTGVAPALAARSWSVVAGESRIAFGGSHAGTAFKGTFQQWTADIAFDPSDLAGSKATVRVDLASAKTGDATYDKTLPTGDWFDTGKTPTAVFTTGAFRAFGGARYEAEGTLEMRGVTVPVTLAFEFTESGETAKITGKTELRRLDFAIGKGSDSGGAWVSLGIPVDVVVQLKAK